MDEGTRRRLRKYGMAAVRPRMGPDGSAWPPPGDVPEVGVPREEPEPSAECRVCGEPVDGAVCEYCGTGTAPPMTALAHKLLYVRPFRLVAVPVAVLAGIYQYTVSPAADLPLLASVILGPLVLAGLAWLAYRTWYRRRYGEGRKRPRAAGSTSPSPTSSFPDEE
jgi:hypothetical protein